jgi:hypothetical protein
VPKILLISYHYPPMATTGARRLQTIASHLSRDWTIIPVTSQNTVHKLPPGIGNNQNLRTQLNRLPPPLPRLATLWAETALYPDAYHSWIQPAVTVAESYISRHAQTSDPIGAIISSGPPVSAHIVASHLAQNHSIPWIAELRDLWSLNHAYPYSRYRRRLDARLELSTLRHASALVTVSHGLQQQLHDLHRKRTYCIPTGYTPHDQVANPVNKKMSILYTGNIYFPYQDPEPLFATIRALIDHRAIGWDELVVDFYCPKYPKLLSMINTYHLTDIVRIHAPVPHQDCLKLQRQADILLILGWNDMRNPGILTLKLWEYLSAGRPILNIGPPNSTYPNELAELLSYSDYAFTAMEPRHIGLILQSALTHWGFHQNSLPHTTNTSPLTDFTSARSMSKYSQLLAEVISSGTKASV